MRILNIIVNGTYTDDFSYQENMLPKYQKALGNDVYILTSEYEIGENGKYRKSDKKKYTDTNGIYVTRLATQNDRPLSSKFKCFAGFYKEIENIAPDFIFCHLFQFLDLANVVKYVKKHPNVRLRIDSHADMRNSARSFFSKHILHKIVWRSLAKYALSYTELFYGVTPARVAFLRDIYKIPDEKSRLLLMGADDELVSRTRNDRVRKMVREKYGIKPTECMVLVGGKIDYNKPEVINLMKSYSSNENCGFRLVVFGSVSTEYEKDFDNVLTNSNIDYAGWLDHEGIYNHFSAADIVIFPGLHSVMWEEAVGYGKPCIFRDLDGFHHIDVGGNCAFFKSCDGDSMIRMIKMVLQDNRLENMKKVAEKIGTAKFSYYRIAEESIK